MKTTRWYLVPVLVFILWGSQIPCLKILSGELPPFPLNTLRFGMSTCVLLPFALHRGVLPRSRDLVGMAGLGVLSIMLYSVLAISGLQQTTAMNGTVLLNTHPLITALLASTVLRVRFTMSQFFGLGLGFVGMMVVVTGGEGIQALLHHQDLPGNRKKRNGSSLH